mgnify:CR=1 FL=1
MRKAVFWVVGLLLLLVVVVAAWIAGPLVPQTPPVAVRAQERATPFFVLPASEEAGLARRGFDRGACGTVPVCRAGWWSGQRDGAGSPSHTVDRRGQL